MSSSSSSSASMRRLTSSTLTGGSSLRGASSLGQNRYANGVGGVRPRGLTPPEQLGRRVHHGCPGVRLCAQISDDEQHLREFLLGLHVTGESRPENLRALVVS